MNKTPVNNTSGDPTTALQSPFDTVQAPLTLSISFWQRKDKKNKKNKNNIKTEKSEIKCTRMTQIKGFYMETVALKSGHISL